MPELSRNMQGHIKRIIRFASVGVLGFAVDTGVLYLALHFGLTLYSGRGVSYFVAATATWYLHRRITFAMTTRPCVGEWLSFLAANAVGGVANIVCYVVLIEGAQFFRTYPVVAVAIGALASLVLTYLVNWKLVFRDPTSNKSLKN